MKLNHMKMLSALGDEEDDTDEEEEPEEESEWE